MNSVTRRRRGNPSRRRGRRYGSYRITIGKGATIMKGGCDDYGRGVRRIRAPFGGGGRFASWRKDLALR